MFIFILLAVFAPCIVRVSPTEMSVNTLSYPYREHLLGTNDIGQDILSRIIYGARHSVLISMSVGFITVTISIIFGSLGALVGGIIDRGIMRVTDIFLAVPELIICLLISAVINPSKFTLIMILSFLQWPVSLKIIRASVIKEKNNNYVLASKIFGANNSYIMYRHIIKGIVPVIVSMFIRNATIAVFMESGLAFLGLLDPSTISWGKIIADAMAYTYLPIWKNWLLPSGIILSIFVVSMSYIGFYVEDYAFSARKESL
jgi:peptide/nickel transport system permease protein